MDLIDLSPANEALRETLFCKIFRESLLVRNRDDLVELRTFLIDEGLAPPAIFTLDGCSIGEGGLFSVMPQNLEYVFGQQNVLESAGYKAAERGRYCGISMFLFFRCTYKERTY